MERISEVVGAVFMLSMTSSGDLFLAISVTKEIYTTLIKHLMMVCSFYLKKILIVKLFLLYILFDKFTSVDSIINSITVITSHTIEKLQRLHKIIINI